MKPARFDYYEPKTLSEALDLLAKFGETAKPLAGGQSLVPMMNMRLARPAQLVDLNGVRELDYLKVEHGELRIGAMTRQRLLERSPIVAEGWPLLREAARYIGHVQIRNRGTVGGNVAHADPASDLPGVLVALDASIHVTGPRGGRLIAAGDFFQGMMTTALEENELLTSVEVPVQGPGESSAYVKLPHPASRYAVIGASAFLRVAGGKCAAASVVLGGLAPAPVRASAVEAALVGQPLTGEAIAKAADETSASLGDDLLGDIYASAEYRKSVAHVYVRRALTAAVGRL